MRTRIEVPLAPSTRLCRLSTNYVRIECHPGWSIGTRQCLTEGGLLSRPDIRRVRDGRDEVEAVHLGIEWGGLERQLVVGHIKLRQLGRTGGITFEKNQTGRDTSFGFVVAPELLA